MYMLSGRAVVTGAASGIGRATAERLRDEGADVLAVDRDAEGLGSLRGVRTLQADLAVEADRADVVEAAAGATYLVNAAALIRLKPIFDITPADIREIFTVNFEAVWHLTSGIAQSMESGSAVVNLSSVSAKLPTTLETAVYASSKAAVLSMTRSFAHALGGRGVRVNAVCPGITESPMQDTVLRGLAELRGSSFESMSAQRLSIVPLGRTQSPSECAGLIAFLLSDQAGYITGQSIVQDGGVITW